MLIGNLALKKDLYALKKQPLQQRSRFTVDAIKEAAAHILREQGLEALNTNLVAERAGVSIGSLYQYFSSKESLIAEIKRDHFQLLRMKIKQAYVENQDKALNLIVLAFINASFEAHRIDPKLHEVLSGDLSKFGIVEDDDSSEAVRASIEQLLVAHKQELRDDLNVPLAAKLCYNLVENIVHETVLYNPGNLDSELVTQEVERMIMSYLKY